MEDTIVAISTSLGVGAISIIRVSGKDAIKEVNKVFKGKNLEEVESHTINYGHIIKDDKIIDEVLISVMKAPKTFTREDVVEINCHGGIIATNKVLEILLENNIRLAEPGEFTKRAFLNGRIDLTQSEAIMDLIESKSDEALQIAMDQLLGKTSNLIKKFREQLKALIASIEVNIDYPEYVDIEDITVENIKTELPKIKNELNKIIENSKNSELIKDGIKTVIIGKPNVGKSSILNQFLEKDKAIVTDIPGTTRDIVEGEVNINGVLLKIIDTAGIRETEDLIEKQGVEKSINYIDDADLIIVVLDGSNELTKEDKEIFEKLDNKNYIIVINKDDLDKKINIEEYNFKNIVSTNTNSVEGIRKLKSKISELFALEKITKKDYNYLNNVRQLSLAKKALICLDEAVVAVNNGLPVDMIEINVKEVFDILGEIIGENYSEEIINHLFDNFCVGK